ncbi:TonB-dependent receptor, partial [Steroidobacter sp.]|uniref:TonB-dependent receptor n=1 Tax=Steroidobacter sp. TaxID=1978227 RepID=UPI001A484D5D
APPSSDNAADPTQPHFGTHGSQKFRLAQTQSVSSATTGGELANEQSEAQRDQDADPVRLEQVTVTASRPQLYSSRVVTSGVLGDKDPIDIPFSIASYSSDLAKLQVATTPAEILKNDPSAQNQGNYIGYQNNVVLRGFPASLGAVRRDGLIAEREGDFPIEVYDRMELIKGVAGFLYGFAEPGGVMNYVTKRPTRDAFATLDVRYLDGAGLYSHIDTGGPIGDGQFGYRANVVYQDREDYTDPNDLRRFVASLAFDAKVSDALLLRLDSSYSTREQPGYLGLPLTTAGTEPPRFDQDELPVPPWARSRWTSSHVGLRADYEVSDNWQVQAQIGYEKLVTHLNFGFITSLQPNGDFEELIFNVNPRSSARYDERTAQLLALGKVSTGPVAHELAFGVFRREEKYEFLDWGGDFSDGVATVTGNLHNIAFGPRPNMYGGPLSVVDSLNTTETHFFIGDTLHFGDHWQAMLGARMVDSDARVEELNVRKTSPSAAVLYKPGESVTMYGSYARSLQYGSKSPSLDGSGLEIVNPNELQPPVEAKQYEVGAKARLTRGLEMAVALYRIELPIDYLDDTTHVYGRFGEQVNQGAEFTVTGNILSNLAVVAGLGYIDAELVRNVDPTLDGNKAAAIAKTTANLFVNYGVSQVPGLSLNAGVYRVGSRYLDLQNQVPVDGYVRTDLGIQYRLSAFAPELTLRLNVTNLFDDFYWEGLGPFSHQYTPGQGRTFILSAQMQLF